jgi:tetratricopeptide (TPR) repeat protein
MTGIIMDKNKAGGGGRSRRNLTLATSLVALTLLVYLPAMRGGFVWDDDTMLTDNIVLKERGLYRSWLTTEQPNYWPVTWTSYWLEYRLWGLDSTGYHVVNVLLHAVSALLIWRILIQLNVPGAWVAAAVFAVHSVNVESVAWITQRKNTLSLFFFLLSLLCYLRFDYRGTRGLYWTALALFVFAMLSKGTVVALPVVLLMCVWWLRSAIGRRDVLRSIPFFAVSTVMSVVEIWFQYVRAIGDEVVHANTFFARLAGAGWVVWFYLYKALLPINLSFIYPRWKIDPTNWLSYIPDLALLGLLGVCWRFRRSWGRAALFALGYFIVTLGPVLGFLNFYFMKYSFVADHYQYVSIIGIIALVVAAGSTILKRVGRGDAQFAYVGTAAVLVVLGLLTWRQGHIYKDHETLWRETLRRNPNAWSAHNNLGNVLARQGDKLEEAIEHYRKALEINPSYAKAHHNLAQVLAMRGDIKEAIEHYSQALQIDPTITEAHNSLGSLLLREGMLEEAIQHFRQAIKLSSGRSEGHFNLGNALVSLGNLEEALKHFHEAVKLKPDFGEAYHHLGLVMAGQGHLDEAIEHFREALRIQPDFPQAHESLGRALALQGNREEAIKHYQEALRILKPRGEARGGR